MMRLQGGQLPLLACACQKRDKPVQPVEQHGLEEGSLSFRLPTQEDFEEVTHAMQAEAQQVMASPRLLLQRPVGFVLLGLFLLAAAAVRAAVQWWQQFLLDAR